MFLKKLKPERLGPERISIHAALGRVAAEDVLAENDLPHFDRSAVDGYAARARDTFEASQFSPKILKLTENEEIHENESREICLENILLHHPLGVKE